MNEFMRDWLRNWKTSVMFLGLNMECKILCGTQLFTRKVQVSCLKGLLAYKE